MRFQNNVASSSGSNQRSSLIGMGFAPSLVDKVIEEKGIIFAHDNIHLMIKCEGVRNEQCYDIS